MSQAEEDNHDTVTKHKTTSEELNESLAQGSEECEPSYSISMDTTNYAQHLQEQHRENKRDIEKTNVYDEV